MFDNLSKLFRERTKFDQTTQDVIESWMLSAQEIERINTVKNDPAWKAIEKRTRDELQMLISSMIQEAKDYRSGRITSLIQVLTSMNTKTSQENLDGAIADFISNLGDDA
jgi:hypothetical protein